MCLVTNWAVHWGRLLLFLPRYCDKLCQLHWSQTSIGSADYLEMLLVWKVHSKLSDEILTCSRWLGHISQAWKQVTRSVTWCDVHMAVCTDTWCGSFSRKELFPMTIQTCGVLRKLGDIRKGGVAFTHLFPVLSWKLVTTRASEFLSSHVRGVGKVCVTAG